MKYIIFDYAVPVLVHEAVVHDTVECEIVAHILRPTSAGFFRVENGQVVCYGRSESLDLGPDNGDAGLIEGMLFGGGE